MLYLTRRYRFSAAHRLYNDDLTAEENARVYGKCANPYGHGHNYVVEVAVAGPLDPATGMVYDLSALDQLVQREILHRFDESYLNEHEDVFQNRVPTAENICRVIFNLLRAKWPADGRYPQARLHRVRVEETNSNFFEYEEPAQENGNKGK
jgi:6-pyruvoyltetrahydropterin/6-carboxytetrahydropterin synthase